MTDDLNEYFEERAAIMEFDGGLLCIDHQDGGGTKHRKELGGVTIFSWLKKNKYPSGFRVLCWNCNSSLGLYGYSPANRNFK